MTKEKHFRTMLNIISTATPSFLPIIEPIKIDMQTILRGYGSQSYVW